MTVTKLDNSSDSESSCDIWDEDGGMCKCCEQFLTKEFKDEILFGHEGNKYKYGDRCYVCNLLHNCERCGEITKMSDYCYNCEKKGYKNREFFFICDIHDRNISYMCYHGGETHIINKNQ